MFTENSSKLIFDVHPIQIVGDATFSNLCCRSYSCINVLKIKYVRFKLKVSLHKLISTMSDVRIYSCKAQKIR